MAQPTLETQAKAETRTLRLSAVIPATDRPPTLGRAIEAMERADEPPDEIVLSRRSSDGNSPQARNGAVRRASGDVLVFVDADVEVHRDVFCRVRAAFQDDPRLDAIFGSYDDAPPGGVVSGFRNLLHHHVHHRAAGAAETFWTGLGAIRRETFLLCGGFDQEPWIRDIDLGMRLVENGASIRLDPEIQGKHLKTWGLFEMLRTDLFRRGAPWIAVLLRHRRSSHALNLGWRNRLSALAAVAVVGGVVLLEPLVALPSLAALVALNAAFYRLLARRQGAGRALLGVVLHIAHLLAAVLSVPVGLVVFALKREGGLRAEPKPRDVEEAVVVSPYSGPERRLSGNGAGASASGGVNRRHAARHAYRAGARG